MTATDPLYSIEQIRLIEKAAIASGSSALDLIVVQALPPSQPCVNSGQRRSTLSFLLVMVTMAAMAM